MLSTLLWSCPICQSEDTLSHKERLLGHDRITCLECKSNWDLIRVTGGPDYKLRLLSGEGSGQTQPLAEWYDQMMAALTLTPVEHPSWNKDNGLPARADEELFLTGEVISGFASPEDPIFQQSDLNLSFARNGPAGMMPLGPGQLFFTSQRLVLKLAVNYTLTNPWEDLYSVDTLIDRFFTISFGDRMYGFAIKGQSVLKWLAYTRLLINQIDTRDGHQIYQGYT